MCAVFQGPRENFELVAAAVLAAVSAVHDVVAEVVPEVAALAPALQVSEAVIVFVAIYMGGSQHYLAAGDGMRFAVLSLAIGIVRRSLAAVTAVIGQHRASAHEPDNE